VNTTSLVIFETSDSVDIVEVCHSMTDSIPFLSLSFSLPLFLSLTLFLPLFLSPSLSLPPSRFWKLDDDGVYLITLNIAKHPDFPSSVAASGKGSKAFLRNTKSAYENREQPLPTANNRNQSSSNLAPKSAEKPVPTPGPPNKGSGEYSPPSVDAVITISPRRGEIILFLPLLGQS
jgi:hypothetical protein